MTDDSNEIVATIHQDYLGLTSDLETNISGLTALNRSFHKHLLIAAASSLEHMVKALVPTLFDRHGTGVLAAFVEKQVMARGYHTLFDWKAGRAQAFFTSFGDACGARFRECLKADDSLKQQHDAFMDLGRRRNDLVHNNYGSQFLELTPSEIKERYDLAVLFVQRIELLVFDDDGTRELVHDDAPLHERNASAG